MRIPINRVEDLGQFLDKPVRVYYHGGELLAIGVFNGGFERTTEVNQRGVTINRFAFILCFGQSNWELAIAAPGLFRLHDIQMEEIVKEIEVQPK